MANQDMLNVNGEVLRQLDTKLRRFSLQAKLELCRKLAHMIDARLGERNFIYSTFSNTVRETYYNDIRSRVYLFELDYISNVSTANGEWSGSLKNKFSSRDFTGIINLYKDYCPPINHIRDTEQLEYSLDLFITRTAFQQFLYQSHPLIHLYRYNYLFNYHGDTFSVRDLFVQEFGSTFNEFVSFVTALFILSKNTNATPLTREQIVRELGKGKVFTQEKVLQLMSNLEMDRETAINKYKEFKSADERMRIYNYNPFTMKPILIHNDHVYIPIPQLLFQAITQGFYHMMSYKYRKQNFKSDFGKFAFEKYINHVLSWQTGYKIIREFEYYIGRERNDSPDFILVKDNEIVLVEIKATAPKVQLKDADVSTYIAELHKSYGVAIKQCLRKEQHIKNGLLTHPMLPKAIKRIYYLIVTLEEFYIMNTSRTRSAVAQYCLNEGYPLPEEKKFHTIGSVTLEQIIETDKRDLFKFLKDREDLENIYRDIPWTNIESSDEMTKIRAVDFWEDEIGFLANDLFGVTV
ncbi:hypothetical protein [Paenibacillus chitinolyticus]|uniref:hypothetical protein n=1 Tax=Paenibacillus chitinolyticus TaxID=79263 RepID=UPI0036340D9E